MGEDHPARGTAGERPTAAASLGRLHSNAPISTSEKSARIPRKGGFFHNAACVGAALYLGSEVWVLFLLHSLEATLQAWTVSKGQP